MELRQLEYFIAVAEELSFARAAGRLNISQPAVSRQVALLERELNTLFFDVTQKKKHKQVVLTEAGSYFYKEALKLIRQRQDMAEGLERLRSRRQTVQVGYCIGMPKEGLVTTLGFLQRELPETEIKLLAFSSAYDQEEALRKHQILFGSGLDTGNPPSGLEALPLLQGHVQVCVSARNPLAKKETLNFHELKNEKWALLAPDRFFYRDNGLPPDYGRIAALAEFDLGTGAVPSFYCFSGPSVRQIDLTLEGKCIPCRQTLLFKKNSNSSLIRKVKNANPADHLLK